MPKRHPSLIPLTHDHHHALAQARRLRLAAAGDGTDLLRQSREFLQFFQDETIVHFREEEETVFPLAVGHERATPLLRQVLLEHLQLHALVKRLSAETHEDQVTHDAAQQVAEALERHIRYEEGEVFPLLEEIVPSQLDSISLSVRSEEGRTPQ